MVVSGSGSKSDRGGLGDRSLTLPSRHNGSRLWIHVHPGKRTDRFYLVEGKFHVDLSSRAVDGQANQQLVRFLGKIFFVPPSLVTISRGSASRYKEIFFPIGQDKLMECAGRIAIGSEISQR